MTLTICYTLLHFTLPWQAWANSVDPDENVVSHQGIHCLPLIQLLLDTTLWRRNDSLKLYRITILFLTIRVLYRGASIAIPDDTPKSTISKENSSFNIFQDHFYNKLQRSKLLLKYTDHLYDKMGHLTQAFLHNNEPLRWFWTCFPRVSKLSTSDLCMKVVSWYVSNR